MTFSKRLPVLAAAAAIILLTGLLAIRLMATPASAVTKIVPKSAYVPEPKTIALADMQYPAWFDSKSKNWELRFKTDLDLIAPLGTGSENAGLWFADFAKPDGPRLAESNAAIDRRVEHDIFGKRLPADDPLLKEAESWCDQATMRYYPDIWQIDGFETVIPNLLVQLTFAKSWAARGLEAETTEEAMKDFRRAIRLGRLLRQDDVTIIADLVGLACVRYGVRGIFLWSTTHDMPEQALLASIILSEVAPQRWLTSERVTRVDLSPFMRLLDDGTFSIEVPDERLDAIIALATDNPDRRFLGEATLVSNVFLYHGTPIQQERARALLEKLAASDDAIIVSMARWSLDTKPSDEYLKELARKFS
jgi:hypothetical protein